MTPPRRPAESDTRDGEADSPQGDSPTEGEAPTAVGTARLRNQDTAVAAAGLLLGAAVLYFSGDIPLGPEGPALGPRWWPRVLAGFMVLTALVLAVNAFRGTAPAAADPEPINKGGFLRLLAVSALFPLYGAAWLNLDFRVCTPLFLAALGAVLGARNWRALVVFPIALTTLMYLVFAVGLEIAL